MAQLFDTLDLIIELITPPQNAPADVLAHMSVRCDALGLGHAVGVFTDPLTPQERADLRWYLETYPDWPFAEFATRGQQIENQLVVIGKRLYQAIFGAAQALLTAWQLSPARQKQMTIISAIPAVLSLPWELLHDEDGFLVLSTRQPVSLLRHLDQEGLPALSAYFVPPLRILVLTPRPVGTGFLDPRGLARELLKAVQPQIDVGTIAVEFLRPPTREALRERLCDVSRPVHLIHFDGHGFLDDQEDGMQGMLLFEDEQWKRDPVAAKELGQLLQQSGVKLAILDACQSAMSSASDAFSSVAGNLIQNGVDAVLAMSASVLAPTSTRFFARFYQELARGTSVPLAQEYARQDLYNDPRRYPFTPHPDVEEGQPVSLRDWWLPHLYQQRPLIFQATNPNTSALTYEVPEAPALPRFNAGMPAEPRYRFGGRAWELLQIERLLLGQQLVIVCGFGGVGKTALAREVADWLTRTGLYQCACFVSFEHGGDAELLLSELGTQLAVNDGTYIPSNTEAALARLQPVLQQRPTLLIADNLESLLPGGEAPLEPDERQRLWHLLRTLAEQGTGILLTSRDFFEHEDDLASVARLSLEGLTPSDAYALASRLLTDLGIDRARAPYADLCTLLAQLDHLPLAIQLVLPALRSSSLDEIITAFDRLLPTFTDDTVTDRHHSLLASLDYSLCRLTNEQRTFLSRLSVFEGGAMEQELLAVTQVAAADWLPLKAALVQAALLTIEPVHKDIAVPFLRFHPILIPYLRSQASANDTVLQARATARYQALALYLYEEDAQHPQAIRSLFARELPNLRRALTQLLESGGPEALAQGGILASLLGSLGRWRERDAVNRQVAAALDPQEPTTEVGLLTQAIFLRESSLGEDERQRGNLGAAIARFIRLLAQIGAQPIGALLGPGSYEHSTTLMLLARSLTFAGRLDIAENYLHQALALLDTLLQQQPDNAIYLLMRITILMELAMVFRRQGHYLQAHELYLQALALTLQQEDQRAQALVEAELGDLAREQGNLIEARKRLQAVLAISQTQGDSDMEAGTWHNLGIVASEHQQWTEAERCYRESLAIRERLGDMAGVAGTCNELSIVALNAGRLAEAEAWLRRALAADAQVNPGPPNATFQQNLARLLVNEARAGHVSAARLAEAKALAEQALTFFEGQVSSTEIWHPLETLARLAEQEGQPEQAHIYRHRAHAAYAAFPGNRFRLERQWKPFITEMVAAARGDEAARLQIEAVLPDLEQKGWNLTDSVHRLWAGECDWYILTEDLNNNSALCVLLVLEALDTSAEVGAAPSTPETLLAALPPSVRDALQQRNQVAFTHALATLSLEEQSRVLTILQTLQVRAEEGDENNTEKTSG